MCMIAVGVVKQKRGPEVTISVDGDIRDFKTDLELEKGDMVMLSGKRIVKKLEVIR